MTTPIIFPKEMVDEIISKITKKRTFMMEHRGGESKFFVCADNLEQAREKFSEQEQVIKYVINSALVYSDCHIVSTEQEATEFIANPTESARYFHLEGIVVFE